MKVKIEYEYAENYLPTPRCRKLRTRTVTATDTFEIKETRGLRLAFEDCYYENEPKLIYIDEEGSLWTIAKESDVWGGNEEISALEALEKCGWTRKSTLWSYMGQRNKEKAVKDINDDLDRWRINDGILYERTGEPRYHVATFGLGHNHGGTGLMTSYMYNPNVAKERYYTALEGDKAVAEANRIAAARGDTNDVGRFKPHIKVHIPEAVRLNPQEEAGEGDPFINSLEKLTESCESSTEAGLLAIALTGAECAKESSQNNIPSPVHSDKIYTPKEYVEAFFPEDVENFLAFCFSHTGKTSLRDWLDSRDSSDLWDRPLSEIDEVMESGSPVVLVYEKNIGRWYEIPTSKD